MQLWGVHLGKKTDIRVLIIDDEESIRESLADYFEDFEFSVQVAETAEEALDIVANASISVAIVDMRLPGIDGNTFIAKAHDINPDIKFIVHTGSVNYTLTPPVRKAGVRPEHILLKPVYNMEEFVRMIEKLVSTKSV